MNPTLDISSEDAEDELSSDELSSDEELATDETDINAFNKLWERYLEMLYYNYLPSVLYIIAKIVNLARQYGVYNLSTEFV